MKVKALVIKPGRHPERVEIENTLEILQEIVGGWIEAVDTDDEQAVILVNEEGKLYGLEKNRALYIDGRLADILYGNIVIVGTDSESGDFASLSDYLLDKYEGMYYHPENFYRTRNGWVAVPAED